MNFEDEKDYLMRLIREMVRMLLSFVAGKQYAQVELPGENKYGVSEGKLSELKAMVDKGEINETENMLLERLDSGDREAAAELVFFYSCVGEKDAAFLAKHRYTQEEVLEGLRHLSKRLGCEGVVSLLEDV